MRKIAYVFLSVLSISLLLVSCEREGHHVTASVIDHSDCKGLKSGSGEEPVPDTLSCISYSYDSLSKTLSLTHINAGFNCCPGKLTCDIDIIGDTLVIHEYESASGCNCDCLFDLEISVERLESKRYTVKIVEPFCGDQQKLILEADLANDPSGSFCAVRKQYPWGMGL
jgi:hypothetical protein